MEKEEFSVSEAVRLVGVESHVLRYWEEELQIRIRRTEQGHRVYTEENIQTFQRVKRLKEKGIQLKAIRVLLEAAGEMEPGLSGNIRKLEQIQDGIEEADGQEQKEEPEKSGENPGDASCEIVCQEETENLVRFELILRGMISEIMEEQNEKLIRVLTERLREELSDIYLRSFTEAAPVAEQKASGGAIRKWIHRYLGKRWT